MKKIKILIFFLFIFVNFTYSNDNFTDMVDDNDSFFTWQPLFFETMHSWQTFYFNIFYYDETSAAGVIDKIDNIYETILNDIGSPMPINFNKINVYIYRTQQEYLEKTQMKRWSGGHLNFRQKVIYTYIQNKLMPSVIAHELTHLILDYQLSFKTMIHIRWLHEGLATYEEKKCSQEWINVKKLKELKKEGRLIPLNKAIYSSMGLEPSSYQVMLWYTEMGLLLDYMLSLEKNGFLIFCQNLKNLRNIDEALAKTYPWNFKNIDELEKNWLKWLEKQDDFIQYN